MKLDRPAFDWLQEQITKLGHLTVTPEEIKYLQDSCPYFSPEYLGFLKDFRLYPSKQIESSFHEGDVTLLVKGTWLDTILYEIPLLALTSEAYFKFCDTDWDHSGQQEKAKEKGLSLLKAGCVFSEFGSRRRRDYKTHDLVMRGLSEAKSEGESLPGKWSGTSNVHFAMKYRVAPIGTVAHEWFMGIAAITNDYKKANEAALQYWTGTFGRGILSIALTDTFGTPNFLEAFKKPVPAGQSTEPTPNSPTYAETWTGVRQDSGDPREFIRRMRNFYDSQNIKDPKTIVFSDSLNVERCIEYFEATKAVGLTPSFGVGTFFTNDFIKKSSGGKSVPLNIVIKLSEAGGRSCIKISDNLGKNMGPQELVDSTKRELGYEEKSWEGGDETKRWNA